MTLGVAPESEGVTSPRRNGEPLLALDDLYVEFRGRRQTVAALNGLSYSVAAGETLAVVGESGSGKSVSAQAVMGILDCPPARIRRGEIRYRGTDILRLPERQRRKLRATKIAMVFQDALSALNPVYTVGEQIAEMFRVHRGDSHGEARRKAIEMMERVRIPDARRRVGDYPHQFSGGMRQRIMIAVALALDPEVLIADEPTTALDVTVQAQIMKLLRELKDESNLALILITHDLGVVAEVADRIAVVYAGQVVEEAPVGPLFASPAHPYTKGLIASIPRLGHRGERLPTLRGAPPTLAAPPTGCPFSPRCPYAQPVCVDNVPPLRDVLPSRRSACHFAEQVLADA
ncbi:MAG TPA: ABC transporter ATP-binding protein [Gaiellaceae bacterium]